jgi:rod shape-determining protein MreC
MYPAGLAVAKVVQVEKVAAGAFGRVVCQPLGGIDRHRQLLIVMSSVARAPRPADTPQPAMHGAPRRNLPKMAPVPVPPLPASPLPAQGLPGQPGSAPGSVAGSGGATPNAAAAPALAPATTAPAPNQVQAGGGGMQPALTTVPAAPAIRKEGE